MVTELSLLTNIYESNNYVSASHVVQSNNLLILIGTSASSHKTKNHIFDRPGAHKTQDGHVEYQDGYYYNDIAVSSKSHVIDKPISVNYNIGNQSSPTYDKYIVGFNFNGTLIDIKDICLIKDFAYYIKVPNC